MPAENYYCPDNFFKKMTDLESPKKNNDCYFYYYSTCAKGDNCTFRHEPSALGCETMCSFWKEGKCLNVHCNFRHMELRKNRKVIPCYWESQPVGCLKAHCPFLHQNPRPSDEISPEKSNISAESNTDVMLKDQMNQPSERKVTAVDSLVVNFEEESDNESAPTFSPTKSGNRIVKVKTLEEIRLEKIQAESAAYYSYYGQDPGYHAPTGDGDDLRERIVRRIISKRLPQERTVMFKPYPQDRIKPRLSNDELANILGDESLRKKQKIVHQKNDSNFQIVLKKRSAENDVSSGSYDELNNQRSKKPLTTIIARQEPAEQNIKIKTLDEIRAERNARREYLYTDDNFTKRKLITSEEKEEAEVSSTSAEETGHQNTNKTIENQTKDTSPRRKIKLRRKLPILEERMSSYEKEENTVSSNDVDRSNSKQQNKDLLSSEDEDKLLEEGDERFGLSLERNNSNKTEDEVLLLEEDDEEYDNVTLKAEEELLNELDSD